MPLSHDDATLFRHPKSCSLVAAQGETVEQQFGEQEVCFRTLDLYTSAVLEASLSPAPEPKKEYRNAMAKMGEVLTP